MNATEARAKYIAQFEADRAELVAKQDSLANVILGQGYVVRCGGLTLGYDVDGATLTATNPKTVPLLKAPRFTRQDAEALAASTRNGHGEQAKAVHIKDALAYSISELDRIIAQLRKAGEA